jgi:hypothetical protein
MRRKKNWNLEETAFPKLRVTSQKRLLKAPVWYLVPQVVHHYPMDFHPLACSHGLGDHLV